jgi:disulfide bond formation protein DsbB
MESFTHYFNVFTGFGVILLQILIVVSLGLLVFTKENKFLDFIKKNFIWIGFFISLAAVLTSEIYSEVIGWVPCFHCWVDRIFIFSQAIIFLVAWIRKDRNVLWYSIALTLFGLVNSIYHLFIYYFSEGAGPCDASGVSCVQRLVNEFGGYISIPMNALTGFAALLALFLVVRFYKKETL